MITLNLQLAGELREAGERERELRSQVLGLRRTFASRKTSIAENWSEVEELRRSIGRVGEERQSLELQLEQILEERGAMGREIDEREQRLGELEGGGRRLELEAMHSDGELELVQRVNSELLGRLEVVTRSRSSSPSGGRVLR